MADRNYNLDNHCKSDKKKWWVTGLALVLGGVFLAAACTQGFKTVNPWGWFDKEEQKQEQEDKKDGGILGEEDEANVASPMSFEYRKLAVEEYGDYGIMPLADTAFTLTVSYTAGIAHTATDYAVKWKSGASGQWGNGKTVTDYVTVTPTSDGALTATITVKKAFGEQVEVVVSNRANPSATKTATVDYAKRMTGFTESKWNISDVELPAVYNSADTTSTTTSPIALNVTQKYASVYTVADTFEMTVVGKLNDSFVSAFTAYAKTTNYYKNNATVKAAIDGMSSASLTPDCSTLDFTKFFVVMGGFCSSWRNLTTDATARTAMASLVAGYMGSDSNAWRTPFFVVTFTFTGSYSTFTKNVHFGYSSGAFGSIATSSDMTLNKSGFVA